MGREAEAKRARIILLIGIVFMILGSFFSSFLTRVVGGVKKDELRFEGPSGTLISAAIHKPVSSSSSLKLPAVVMVAGEYDDKESLESMSTELARLGVAVLSIDSQGHGDTAKSATVPEYGNIIDAAEYLRAISYIDSSRIAVIGFGKYACDMVNKAIVEDNEGDGRLFSAALYVAGDPMYMRDGAYVNLYEGRHVGIVSAMYDDLSHHGETGADGQPGVFAPGFAESFNAISFLNFGRNPSRLSADSDSRMNVIYRFSDRQNGAIRVIYQESVFRPDIYYSPSIMKDMRDFLSQAYGLQAASFGWIWPYKALLDAISLFGFVIFVMSICVLFTRTQAFADVSLLNGTDEDYMVFPRRIAKGDVAGRLWFWLSLAGYVSLLSCLFLRLAAFGYAFPGPIAQRETFAISSWLFVCGLCLLITVLLWHRLYSSQKEINLVRLGVVIPKAVAGKTILLAVIVAFISYAVIFLCNYVFSAGIGFFFVSLQPFSISRLIRSVWPYMPMMAVFFISLSLFQNTILHSNLLGSFNAFLTALFSALPAVLLPLIQRIGFAASGKPVFFNSFIPYNEFVLWLIPLQIALFAGSLASRYVFTRTKNSYLPGIINAIIVTLMIASSTQML